MNSLKELLLRQYIGAIVIGLLAYQGLASLFGALAAPVYILAQSATSAHSVFGSPSSGVHWNDLLPGIVRGVVFLVVSYLLIRWLYGAELQSTPEAVVGASE